MKIFKKNYCYCLIISRKSIVGNQTLFDNTDNNNNNFACTDPLKKAEDSSKQQTHLIFEERLETKLK